MNLGRALKKGRWQPRSKTSWLSRALEKPSPVAWETPPTVATATQSGGRTSRLTTFIVGGLAKSNRRIGAASLDADHNSPADAAPASLHGNTTVAKNPGNPCRCYSCQPLVLPSRAIPHAGPVVPAVFTAPSGESRLSSHGRSHSCLATQGTHLTTLGWDSPLCHRCQHEKELKHEHSRSLSASPPASEEGSIDEAIWQRVERLEEHECKLADLTCQFADLQGAIREPVGYDARRLFPARSRSRSPANSVCPS